MAYPQNMLNDDEEIVLDRHPHWSFMISPVVMITLTLIFTIVIAAWDWHYSWIGGICVAFALIGSVGRYIRWRCINFVVTTDRIIVRHGVLSKNGIEIPLDRVMNISYHQALWERILGTGDLVVESAGESGHQAFTDVAHPSLVQNLIYRQAEIYEGRGSASSGGGLGDERGHASRSSTRAAAPSDSIPDQIEKLDRLRQRGILSEEEFSEKKQSLLDRL